MRIEGFSEVSLFMYGRRTCGVTVAQMFFFSPEKMLRVTSNNAKRKCTYFDGLVDLRWKYRRVPFFLRFCELSHSSPAHHHRNIGSVWGEVGVADESDPIHFWASIKVCLDICVLLDLGTGVLTFLRKRGLCTGVISFWGERDGAFSFDQNRRLFCF